MKEISCPNCHKAFTIDEAGYADILRQVRDTAFKQQIDERMEVAEKEKASAVELARTEVGGELIKTASQKDAEIQKLKSEIEGAKMAEQLAVNKATAAIEKERDDIASALKQVQQENEAATKLANVELSKQIQETESKKNAEIQSLRDEIKGKDVAQQLAITQALTSVEKERDDLRNGLDQAKLEKQLSEKSLEDKYRTQLKDRDNEIERMRDYKAKLSTKMVGETLEIHCETEFNRIRASAFPYAYFEKDNDAKSGSKGDYIFRDSDESDTEIVSIMFEMKNESDTTATKKKNEDFLKELDKDRTEKNCEYAILVSLLEPESELYNTGIVDVSYRYPKMYVVRPQFFIPIITLLRNAGMKSLEYKTELAIAKTQHIDITNFESDLEKFKSAFSKNYELASRQFETAIVEIDKSIDHLQKTKDALQSSARNLRLANNKAQDVTIKKLTRKNQTMTSKFDDLQNSDNGKSDQVSDQVSERLEKSDETNTKTSNSDGTRNGGNASGKTNGKTSSHTIDQASDQSSGTVGDQNNGMSSGDLFD